MALRQWRVDRLIDLKKYYETSQRDIARQEEVIKNRKAAMENLTGDELQEQKDLLRDDLERLARSDAILENIEEQMKEIQSEGVDNAYWRECDWEGIT